MFQLFNNTTTKYHRFQYHPRNYDEKKRELSLRKKRLEEKSKNKNFDIIAYHQSKKKKSNVRFDLISIVMVFLGCLLFADKIDVFFRVKSKYGEFGIYFLLILLGLMFINRSRR